MRRTSILVLSCVLTAAACVASSHAGEAASLPAFEKMKTLVGSWVTKGPDGAPVRTTYRLVSSGTALMEELDVQGMITIYHPDGDSMMLTHYCAGNNQPRMRARALTADGSRLVFAFQDVSNLATPETPYMSDLTITFKDADHFSQEWTHTRGGNRVPWTFEWERVK